MEPSFFFFFGLVEKGAALARPKCLVFGCAQRFKLSLKTSMACAEI
jgi:hypothetical protein